MSRSRAAVYLGVPGELEIQSIETPTVGPGEILVRVLGCTLCGSDQHSLEGRREVAVPTILGHEIVGEIVAIGAEAPAFDLAGTHLTIGSRVTWAIVANCSNCFFCDHDLPQKCLHAVKYGHEAMRAGRELLGGLAEHCLLVSGTSLVVIPDRLSLSIACPASCATATVAAALESAGSASGKTICVMGAGLLGLTACAMSRYRGAQQVICVDVRSERRERAQRFADLTVAPEELAGFRDSESLRLGFDWVLDFTGSPQAFESGWSHVRTGGVVVLVGAVFPADPVSLRMDQVVRRQLTLKGVHNYAPRHLLQAIQFLEATQEQYPWEEMVSTWLPLAEAATAFELARDGNAVRIGVLGS